MNVRVRVMTKTGEKACVVWPELRGTYLVLPVRQVLIMMDCLKCHDLDDIEAERSFWIVSGNRAIRIQKFTIDKIEKM